MQCAYKFVRAALYENWVFKISRTTDAKKTLQNKLQHNLDCSFQYNNNFWIHVVEGSCQQIFNVRRILKWCCINENLVTDERKAVCYQRVTKDKCTMPVRGTYKKDICCCSVGAAWGRPCEECPLKNTSKTFDIASRFVSLPSWPSLGSPN